MATRNLDPRPFFSQRSFYHYRPNPLSVAILLPGNLFGFRQNRLEFANFNHHSVFIPALLNNPGNHFAFFVSKRAQHLLVLGFPQSLHNDRAGSGSGDPAKTRGGVIEFADLVAIFIDLGCHHHYMAVFAINFYPRVI